MGSVFTQALGAALFCCFPPAVQAEGTHVFVQNSAEDTSPPHLLDARTYLPALWEAVKSARAAQWHLTTIPQVHEDMDSKVRNSCIAAAVGFLLLLVALRWAAKWQYPNQSCYIAASNPTQAFVARAWALLWQ